MFIGFILFDYHGIHRYRSAQLYQCANVEITYAEAHTVCEAIDHVVQQNGVI